MNLLLISSAAIGGAIGAVSRYGLSHFITHALGNGFPYATMVVNIIGSLIMGVLIGLFANYYTPSPEIKALLITGILGSFTTFSTFSLDAVSMIERNNYIGAGGYILSSVVLSIFAVFIGLYIVRGLVN